jgi:glutaredoxin-like protein NrdH
MNKIIQECRPMDKFTHVKGKDKGNVVLYALSTCVWCKKARQLLDDLKVEYYYVYVDNLDQSENEKTKEEVKKWNPKCTFPTIVINNNKCITGFQEDQIRKELG